jgi:hypothetical protein
MGSMVSTDDRKKVGRKRNNKCKVKSKAGQLCQMTTGPGQIQAIRQSVYSDDNGIPLLEEFNFDNDGKVIDSDGTWVLEVPMNLDYVYTDELGNQKVSNNPDIGVPTKGKYRFKVKWQQPASLTEQTRRAYFLVPNVREYGWTGSDGDPNYNIGTTNNDKRKQNLLASSYYFGLDWNGYVPSGVTGFTSSERIQKLNEIIDCQDTFYEFKFNRVYTVSNLIDEYKKGTGRGRFLGIKEIDDNACESTVNKFPTNDAQYDPDLVQYIIDFFLLYVPGFISIFLVLLLVIHLINLTV